MGGADPFAAVQNAIEHYRVDDILDLDIRRPRLASGSRTA